MKAGWIGFPREDDDFWASATTYAQTGYKGMEGGDNLIKMGNDSIQRFHELGLEILTATTSIYEIRDNLDAVVERAKLLKTNRATMWFGSMMFEEQPTKSDFFAELESMENAAEELAKEGIQLCYHNHDKEFTRCYNNVMAIDHMLLNTKHLKLTLDVAWVAWAGLDPVSIIKRCNSRIAAMHIKDYVNLHPGNAETPTFTSLGTGTVGIARILECLHQHGHEWVVYEQDTLRNLSGHESMLQSYLYMKETGLVE